MLRIQGFSSRWQLKSQNVDGTWWTVKARRGFWFLGFLFQVRGVRVRLRQFEIGVEIARFKASHIQSTSRPSGVQRLCEGVPSFPFPWHRLHRLSASDVITLPSSQSSPSVLHRWNLLHKSYLMCLLNRRSSCSWPGSGPRITQRTRAVKNRFRRSSTSKSSSDQPFLVSLPSLPADPATRSPSSRCQLREDFLLPPPPPYAFNGLSISCKRNCQKMLRHVCNRTPAVCSRIIKNKEALSEIMQDVKYDSEELDWQAAPGRRSHRPALLQLPPLTRRLRSSIPLWLRPARCSSLTPPRGLVALWLCVFLFVVTCFCKCLPQQKKRIKEERNVNTLKMFTCSWWFKATTFCLLDDLWGGF